MLNVLVILFGVLSLIYGIRKKITFWMVIGACLVCFGAFSAYVDFKTAGMDSITNFNSRLPFMLK